MKRCDRHNGRGATPLLEEVGFLLTPDFSLLCLSVALDALRQANRVAEEMLTKLSDSPSTRCAVSFPGARGGGSSCTSATTRRTATKGSIR